MLVSAVVLESGPISGTGKYKLELSSTGNTWVTIQQSQLKDTSDLNPDDVKNKQRVLLEQVGVVGFVRFTSLSSYKGNAKRGLQSFEIIGRPSLRR